MTNDAPARHDAHARVLEMRNVLAELRQRQHVVERAIEIAERMQDEPASAEESDA